MRGAEGLIVDIRSHGVAREGTTHIFHVLVASQAIPFEDWYLERGISCSSLDDGFGKLPTLPRLDEVVDKEEIHEEKSLNVTISERKYPAESILSANTARLVRRRTTGTLMCFKAELRGPALFTSGQDLNSVMKEKSCSLVTPDF